ncbi:MAG: LytR C-terminal domain-containing protein [Candidatus Latescibacteria bacterium]|nr:LytR C-terminal domain-containing protein [Candidatus Latescibacterota bacterium]MCK5380147.1 LytR C-terminal domain-containing protein [Candidatus Latescibacterota bacterium]
MREFERLAVLIACYVTMGCLVGGCERSVQEEESPGMRIKVEVLNGCAEPGIARKFSRMLRAKGFDVVNGDGSNAEHFGFLETIVVDRCGELEKAKKVAKVLGTKNTIQQVREAAYHVEEVTVVIGRDFKALSVK